jgi:hypothetical protein
MASQYIAATAIQKQKKRLKHSDCLNRPNHQTRPVHCTPAFFIRETIMKCQYITEDGTCYNETETGYLDKLIMERNDTIEEMRLEINLLKAEIKHPSK